MIRTLFISLLVLVSPNGLADSRWGAPGDPVFDRIDRGARLWLESVCEPRPELADYFSKDFQGTGIDGARYGRERPLAFEGGGRDCRFDRLTVQIFDERVAVADGNESVIFGQQDERACLAWTDTWLNENGVWRIIAAQDNFVACEADSP